MTPTQMYMVSGHLDGRSGGDGFDDDGSGVALVLEMARVLAGADVTTDKSVRFIFWDKEEGGLYGSNGLCLRQHRGWRPARLAGHAG